MRWGTCFLLLALLGSAGSASADVVGPEPSSCPHGGRPSSCHGGPYCELRECTSDAECTNGATCRELAVCVGKVGCAGLIGPGEDAAAYDRASVEASCAGGASCPGTSTCETKRLCAEASMPATSTKSDDCSVSTPGSESHSGGIAALVLVASVLVRSRRRARRASGD